MRAGNSANCSKRAQVVVAASLQSITRVQWLYALLPNVAHADLCRVFFDQIMPLRMPWMRCNANEVRPVRGVFFIQVFLLLPLLLLQGC